MSTLTPTADPARDQATATPDDTGPGTPPVRIRGVVRRFDGRAVLDGLDLDIAPSEFVILLGQSGSGKSTLLRLLGGLDLPDAGSVTVPRRRAIVFQADRLLPWQRVWRNVTIGLTGRDAKRTALKVLDEVGLVDHADAWPRTLSGGEAQRVALARALVSDPRLVLLDEPFAALDALTRLRMHDLVRGLRAKHDAAMLLVTHDVDEGDYLIVPKGSPIKTLADLRGKKVGYPAGSSAHGFLLNAVQSVGLGPDSVTFVNLAPAALQSAFASGQLDAASLWNPQVTLDVQKGARILAAGTRPLDPNVGFYVASDKALKDPQRRALVADLLARLGRAYQYGDEHLDVWAKDVQAETGIDADTAKIVVENGTVTVRYVSEDTIQAEQKLADTFIAAKQITQPVDVRGIIDNLLPASFDGK